MFVKKMLSGSSKLVLEAGRETRKSPAKFE